MRVTIMGHAGLFVEAGQERILVDPVLRTTPLGSMSVVHTFKRSLDLKAMPKPTLLILTHGHLDHYDPPSLVELDKETPVVVPNDVPMIHELGELGFKNLIVLAPWDSHQASGIKITAIPSHAEIDEYGLLFDEVDQQARFLHFADAEPSLEDARRIRQENGPIELSSIKFQPASPGHGVFRGLGAWFDKSEVAEWLECAVAVEPRFAFPYASGVRYDGRHAWLNRYAFPFRGDEIVTLMTERVAADKKSDRAQQVATVRPGDVFDVNGGSVIQLKQSSPFVHHIDDGSTEPAWEPFDSTTLVGLSNDEEREELQTLLLDVLRKEIAPWIAERLGDEGSPLQTYAEYGVVYQLVIHTGEDQTIDFAIDFGSPRRTLTGERHPRANFTTHVSGLALLEVLRGMRGPELFYMSGDARIFEKIFLVREGQFWIPPVQGWDLYEQLPELLTHYLRHTRPSR